MKANNWSAAVVGLSLILVAGCGVVILGEAPEVAAARERQALNRMPIAVKRVRPKYPAEMRRAGFSGEVLVQFTVTMAGDVENAEAVRRAENGSWDVIQPRVRPTKTEEPARQLTDEERANPEIAMRELASRMQAERDALAPEDKDFAPAAVVAVRQWKFQPALLDGKPVAFVMTVPIVFTLNEN